MALSVRMWTTLIWQACGALSVVVKVCANAFVGLPHRKTSAVPGAILDSSKRSPTQRTSVIPNSQRGRSAVRSQFDQRRTACSGRQKNAKQWTRKASSQPEKDQLSHGLRRMHTHLRHTPTQMLCELDIKTHLVMSRAGEMTREYKTALSRSNRHALD